MTALAIINLVVQVIIFALWAFLMFRTLFELRRRGAKRTGSTFPGVGATLAEWGKWLRAPKDAGARRRLGLTTLALFASIAAGAIQTP